jgi:Leucine-rich repeat (LRR) protein/PKD repeat protein
MQLKFYYIRFLIFYASFILYDFDCFARTQNQQDSLDSRLGLKMQDSIFTNQRDNRVKKLEDSIINKIRLTYLNSSTNSANSTLSLDRFQSASSSSNLPTPEEYAALIDFYNSTGGLNWANNNGWRDANPNTVQAVSDWFGIIVDDFGHVISLSLPNNKLTGSLSPTFGNLTYLKELNLSSTNVSNRNQIGGTIPQAFGNLLNLVILRLDINLFSGSLPLEIWNLSKLQFLSLFGNQFLTGTIPSAIGNLKDLIWFDASSNQFSGEIPSALGECRKLQRLVLYSNQLSGTIPNELGNCMDLTDLYLANNELGGIIPESVVRNCIKIKTLDLSENKFFGAIDGLFDHLFDLSNLQLRGNNFSGTIPASISNLKKIAIMDLSRNKIEGSIPHEIASCVRLVALYLNQNKLSGTIPWDLGYLYQLQRINLGGNLFSGSIPSEIGNCLKLELLDLSNNKLTGSIPLVLSLLPQLKLLNVSSNLLTGAIPVGTLPVSIPNVTTPLSGYCIYNNNFTFTDILPAISNFNNPLFNNKFRYWPQNPVDVFKSYEVCSDKPLTLTTTIDRDTSTPSLYQWFVVGIALSNPSANGHTTTISAAQLYQTGYLHYTISNPQVPNLLLTSYSQYLKVIPSGKDAVSINFSTSKFMCAVKFLPTLSFLNNSSCDNLLFLWSFGDGTTSSERSPLHVYSRSGNYNVSLKLIAQCSGCVGEVNITKSINYSPVTAAVETLLIEAETDLKNQVINASAATFSDSWSLPHDNTALSNKSSYLNGTQGVWRNNASYVYNVPRQLSANTNLAKDGTYTLNQFDWGSAEFNIVPNWIQANTMTQYSPYSYELENKDVLGVYSAALYDYGGHLPSANGVNMRNAEMAFTSFEVSDGKPSGNWMLSNTATPASATYKVPIANNYIVVVQAPLQEFDLVQKVDVNAESFWFSFFYFAYRKQTNYLQDVEVLCKQQHPTNPNWSVLVLGRAPFDGLWYGNITVKKTVLPTVVADFDGTVAHSGKTSLRIMADKTFRQELLEVEEGKSYWVNAWVTVQNGNQVTTPKLADNLGIEITLKNKQGQVAGTVSFQPTGTIIEGWQQVKGTFTSPIKNPLIEIKFKAGSKGTAWYDDLRLQPEKGNMKAYVYNLDDYRLQAILDEENYASFFYYDKEGNLYLTKKETERGIKTVSENVSYQVEKK